MVDVDATWTIETELGESRYFHFVPLPLKANIWAIECK